MAEQGVADEPILITPRTLVKITGGLIVLSVTGYIWLFATFVTLSTHEALAMDFEQYVIGQDVRRLQVMVVDAKDKLWDLERRMAQPDGQTQMNIHRKHELKERNARDEKTIECLQAGKQHCWPKNGSG